MRWLRYALVSKSTENPDEELARHIVSTVLGVPVDRFEDGTAPRQVDALIRFPDCDAALEIVADHDEVFKRQQDALYRKHQEAAEVSGLRKSWMVVLSHEANIKDVKRRLPALLLDLQDNAPPSRQPWDVKPWKLDELGVTRAWPMNASTVSGRVYLVQQSWGGFAGDERTVGGWVERVLEDQNDVPTKLAAHPDVADRHAFLWATITSDMGVQMQLDPREEHPFPVTPPTLPEGVTHVWVADGAAYRGVLAWFPERGWWRTPWTRPEQV
jgi:hypothetical protein